MALSYNRTYVENQSTGKALEGVVVRVYKDNVLQNVFADESSTPLPTVQTGEDGSAIYYVDGDGVYEEEYVYNGDILDRVKVTIFNPANYASSPNVDAIIGAPAVDGDLGTFSGATIPDNSSAKTALQSLETATELRPTSATLAASGGSALTGHLQAGANATGETVQARLRKTPYVSGTPSIASINAGLTDADTAGGRGALVRTDQVTYGITSTITMPDRVRLVGSTARATIYNSSTTGAHFLFDGIAHGGLVGARLGFGSSATERGIEILTTAISSRDLTFADLEIASGGVSGQIGINLLTSGVNIITECSFDRLVFKGVDRPIVDNSSEGNFFTNFTIDGYAISTARPALDLITNANYYQGRIAGITAASSSGYKQQGARNIAILVVDIGAAREAINLANDGGNIVILSRPETLTPIGTIGRNNTVVDTECTYVPRIQYTGGTPTSAQFDLTDFGTGATVTEIAGSDARHRFKITCGTAPTPNPLIKYTYLRAWETAPIVQVTRRGGTTALEYDFTETTTYYQFRLFVTPSSGNQFDICCSVA
jgi:hypothetical protein